MDAQAQRRREELVLKVERDMGPFDPRYLEALRAVPREKFVRPGDEAQSSEDMPLPLDNEGNATISAPHAYLLSFRVAGLTEGDTLLELGSGTGYGAALASEIVGPHGKVSTLEIDPSLESRARGLLADRPNVRVLYGDAMTAAPLFEGVRCVICTFSVAAIPAMWAFALAEGSCMVVPVGPPRCDQRLVRVVRRGSAVHESFHGAVRYVSNRSVVV